MREEIKIELSFLGEKHSIDAESFSKLLNDYIKLIREIDKSQGKNKLKFELEAFNEGSFVAFLKFFNIKGERINKGAAIVDMLFYIIAGYAGVKALDPSDSVQQTTINNVVNIENINFNTSIYKSVNSIFMDTLRDHNILGLSIEIDGRKDTILRYQIEEANKSLNDFLSRQFQEKIDSIRNSTDTSRFISQIEEKDLLSVDSFIPQIVDSSIYEKVNVRILNITKSASKYEWILQYHGINIKAKINESILNELPYEIKLGDIITIDLQVNTNTVVKEDQSFTVIKIYHNKMTLV